MKFDIPYQHRNSSGIYSILNLVNGNAYVGKASNLWLRYQTHKTKLALKYSTSPKLQNAFIRYGAENFSFVVLEICDKNYLIEREGYWISRLNSDNVGYNTTKQITSRWKPNNHSSSLSKRTIKYFPTDFSSEGLDNDEDTSKSIPSFEGFYTINIYGKVVNINTNHSPSTYIGNHGYRSILLIKNKVKKIFLLHRLLAITFKPNPKNLKYVNHKDGNKLNNKLSNLEWCDFSFNQLHAYRVLGKTNGQKGLRNTKKSKEIAQYTLSGDLLRKWPSAAQAYREKGYAVPNTTACANGKRKTAYGFLWRYEKL